MAAAPKTLSPRQRPVLTRCFYKLLYEKNSDSERTAIPITFTTDSIWGTDDLDVVNKETIIHVTINQLRKLDYIILHADSKLSINDIVKAHSNEQITIPEDI
jgi:hypothetical protein